MIRLATDFDLPAILAMAREAHAESPTYSRQAFDSAKVERLYRYAKGLLLSPNGCVYIATENDNPVGMVAGLISENWFGPDRYFSEVVVFVRQTHRGGATFLGLVKAMKRWANDEGIDDIRVGVSSGVNMDRTVRAYQRLGFRLKGYSMGTDHG